LGFRASRRRGYAPFALGLLAAMVVLIGKFWFGSNPAMYGGIALLVSASLWNSWPEKTDSNKNGQTCCSTHQLHQVQPFSEEASNG